MLADDQKTLIFLSVLLMSFNSPSNVCVEVCREIDDERVVSPYLPRVDLNRRNRPSSYSFSPLPYSLLSQQWYFASYLVSSIDGAMVMA